MGYSAIRDERDIEALKAQWPCHNLPEELSRVVFYFESNGDLCDIEASDEAGRPLDSSEFDGAPLLALCEDAQKAENYDHWRIRYDRS